MVLLSENQSEIADFDVAAAGDDDLKPLIRKRWRNSDHARQGAVGVVGGGPRVDSLRRVHVQLGPHRNTRPLRRDRAPRRWWQPPRNRRGYIC